MSAHAVKPRTAGRMAQRLGACALSLVLALQMGSAALYGLAPQSAWAAGAQLAPIEDDASAQELVSCLKGGALDGAAVTCFDGSTVLLEEGGVYQLAQDVTLDATLQLAAGAGEVIVLDLNGHTLCASGALSCALDVSSSLGTVAVVDSSAWGSAAQDGVGTGGVRLCMQSVPDGCEEAAVIACAPEQDGADDAAGNAALLVAGVNLSVRLSQDVSVDSCAGIAAGGMRVYLDGALGFDAPAEEAAPCQFALASTACDSFTFLDGFCAEQPLQIDASPFVEGDVFAHIAEGYDPDAAAEAITLLPFEDPSLACGFDGVSAFEFTACATAQAADAATGTEEGEALAAADEQQDGSAGTASLSIAGVLATLAATDASGTDLCAAWTSAGTGSSYTISTGGTYYLSDDLSTSQTLYIDASGQSVELDFGGHTFTNTNGAGKAIDIKAATAVTIVGDGGELFLNGAHIDAAISSAADALSISDLVVRCKTSDSSVNLKDLSGTALYVSAGQTTLQGCSLTVDLSNQINSTTSGNSGAYDGPSAVYLDTGAGAAGLSDCSLTVRNSEVVPVVTSKTDTPGYAHGVYSATSSAVTLDGCSIDVTSTLGIARGVQGGNLVFSGEGTSVALEAYESVVGVYVTAEQGARLAAPLSVTFSESGSLAEVALQSTAEDGFVFCGGVELADASVQVGTDESRANDDGQRIGTFDSTLGSSARSALAGRLLNALGEDGACVVAADASGLYFALDEELAFARLIAADGTSTLCASPAVALDAAAAGETVQLLRDAGEVVFDKDAQAGETFTLDLNGHEIECLRYTSAADLVVCSSSGQASIEGRYSTGNAAVSCASAGALTISDVDITCTSATSAACGIYTTSTCAITLTDVNISVATTRETAYGIRSTSTSAQALSISGGSIEVSALAYGVRAYGITSSSKSNQTTVAACPIAVQGTSTTTHGIDVASSFALEGEAGVTSIAVSTETTCSNVVGVYASRGNDDAVVELDSCTVAVDGAQDDSGSYWCLGTGGGTNDPVWSLQGACSLESCTETEIQHYAQSLQLAESFSVAQDALHVCTLGSGAETFAQLAQGCDADALAALFCATPGSAYDGFTVVAAQASDGATLAWEGSASIRNTSTGTEYKTLEAALAAAASGATLRLDSDVRVNGTIDVSASVTLDLNGHLADVEAGGDAVAGSAREGGACTVTGGATLRVCDSSSQADGELAFVVGGTSESTGETYQGIAVSEGSTLVVDGACVSVCYGGSYSSQVKIALRGVALANGSLQALGASRIEVDASEEEGVCGASEVRGVWVSASSSGQVSLSEETQLAVCNAAEPVTLGSSYYPDTADASTNSSAISANLVEIDLDEDGELYQEIAEEFLEQAVCDTSTETSSVYGANIYYATRMIVDSGLSVWAFSEQVSDEDIGTLECIVPAHIFLDAAYIYELDAYGLYVESGSAASVEAACSISAQTTLGNAYAAYGCSDYATWGLSESKLEASCSDESYLSVAASQFDLNDYLDLTDEFASTEIYYPTRSNLQSLKLGPGTAALIGATSSSSSADWGMLAEEDLYETLFPALTQQVEVTFGNIHEADGSTAEQLTCTLSYGQTFAEAGYTDLVADDYTVDDVTYRFVGWRLSGLATGSAYAPAAVLEDLVFDSNVTGVTDGSVSFTALYIPVSEGEHLVTFRSESIVYAYPVEDGELSNYGDCCGISETVVPTFSSEFTGYSYGFAGWVEEDSSTCFVCDDDVLLKILPASEEDVTYTARYSNDYATTSITLVYRLQLSSGGSTVYTDENDSFQWWEQTISGYAAQAVEGMETVNDKGTIYTLLGWSTRATDVEPLYSNDSWGDVDDSWSDLDGVYLKDGKTFYAVYAQSTQTVDVKFYSVSAALGSILLGSVEGAAATSTVSAVLAQAGIDSSSIASPTASLQFRGWNTSYDADEIIEASTNTLYDLVGTGSSLNLYVIWKTRSCSVTFCDSDGTVLGVAYADYGTTLLETDPTFSITGLRSSFSGWAYESGESFWPETTVVRDDITVYAVYSKTSSDANAIAAVRSGNTSSSASGLGSSLSLASSLSSQGLAAALSTDADDGGTATKAASGISAGTAQAATLADGDDGASDEADGTLASAVALLATAALLVGFTVFVLRWFARRQRENDGSLAATAGCSDVQRIRF